uniref:Tdc-1 n=1 Tax=Pristionchus pacificus TaxID=54126 RepID=A0A8R1UFC1_PRIPA
MIPSPGLPMVYEGLNNALKNFNSFCADRTSRIRDSFSPTRSTSAAGSESAASSTQSASTSGKEDYTVYRMPNSTAATPDDASVVDDRMDFGVSREEFRRIGKDTIEYIAEYHENIGKRRVVPAIEPGYLRDLMPHEAPKKPETFESVLEDFERLIMPGVTHWQHPRFHAYFPAGNSYPSLIANFLGDALGTVGFSWASCPAMTELELVVLHWYGKMIGLPPEFLPLTEGGRGGGVIQSSASECNFVSLLAARFEVMKELRKRFPFVEEGLLLSKLIAYCSKEAHSSVEKACMIGMVKLRILETDSKFRLRGETLRNAIQEDRNLGLIPFFVSTTLGTTSCCSFDVLSEIGPVATDNDIWLHVDAAYAGSGFICPENRHLLTGIEHAMSFNTNPNKWMLVHFDCSAMWVRDRFKLTQALVVDPLYLQHSWTEKSIDYRHWGIPLSRRFRALKLWFVIRMYGVEGLQKYIRNHIRLARRFETLLKADPIFEIVGDVQMGLVCFRMRGTEEVNQQLLTRLNSSGRIHMVPASLNNRFVIRFCVCAEHAADRDITIAYDIISQTARTILHESVAEPIEEDAELEELEETLGFDGMTLESPIGHSKSMDRHKSIERNKSVDRTPSLDKSDSDDLNRRHNESIATKRSFLVRMVSDPKCYNPKIVRHLHMANFRKISQDLYRDRSLMQTISYRPARLGSGGSGARTSDGPHFDDVDGQFGGPFGDEDDVPPPEVSQTGVQTPI